MAWQRPRLLQQAMCSSSTPWHHSKLHIPCLCTPAPPPRTESETLGWAEARAHQKATTWGGVNQQWEPSTAEAMALPRASMEQRWRWALGSDTSTWTNLWPWHFHAPPASIARAAVLCAQHGLATLRLLLKRQVRQRAHKQNQPEAVLRSRQRLHRWEQRALTNSRLCSKENKLQKPHSMPRHHKDA